MNYRYFTAGGWQPLQQNVESIRVPQLHRYFHFLRPWLLFFLFFLSIPKSGTGPQAFSPVSPVSPSSIYFSLQLFAIFKWELTANSTIAYVFALLLLLVTTWFYFRAPVVWSGKRVHWQFLHQSPSSLFFVSFFFGVGNLCFLLFLQFKSLLVS